MEAYAVFEGGGVKGAALAGALAAAEEHNIKFVGYGGASAGAIVAYLSTIGYNSKDLFKILLENSFISFFDDNSGEKLDHLKSFGQTISDSSSRQLLLKTSPAIYYIFSERLRKTSSIFNDVCEKKGIYSTDNIKKLLIELTKKKLPQIIKTKGHSFNFEDLYSITGIELKIITSDVHNKNAVIFCHDNKETSSSCVISAVCASASYPFVFRPNFSLKGTSTLIDGGLSSNLPTFLFNNKSHKKIPIYAFDLFKEKESIGVKKNKIDEFAMSIVNTALDASDHIMYGLVDAIRINVRVPDCIDTLDFKIKKIDVIQMYETGKHSAYKSFSDDPLTKKTFAAGSDVTKLARALYGTSLYMPILESIIKLHTSQPSDKVRAWLYTSVSNNDSEVVAICWHGTNNTTFSKQEYLFDTNSCSDTIACWKAQRVLINEYIVNGEDITRLCLPIFEKHSILIDVHNKCKNRIVGVLVLEINLCKKLLFCINDSGDDISDAYREIIKNWLSIISKVMISKEV